MKKNLTPPRNFRPVGPLEWVKYSPEAPPFIRNPPQRGRRAEGIRYERKVQTHLSELYNDYVASPWFIFKELGTYKTRWCQPDGLLFNTHRGQITIMECKLRHTAEAWWQMKWLYLPVIAKAFPPDLWRYGMCEVVKWYDPATPFPEETRFKATLAETRPGEIGVHIYKP